MFFFLARAELAIEAPSVAAEDCFVSAAGGVAFASEVTPAARAARYFWWHSFRYSSIPPALILEMRIRSTCSTCDHVAAHMCRMGSDSVSPVVGNRAAHS